MATAKFTVQPFEISADDPLAEEHRCVWAWVEEALGTLNEHDYYKDVELKSLPSGRKLLDAKPEQARRYVLAAVAQARYWDQLADKFREWAENEHPGRSAPGLPGWDQVWGRRRQTDAVIRNLMRRSIAFERDDLKEIVEWCNASESVSSILAPLGLIVRAIERYAAEHELDSDLRGRLWKFRELLQTAYGKDVRRWASDVAGILGDQQRHDAEIEVARARPRPTASAAGDPRILTGLKRLLRILPEGTTVATSISGPDEFAQPDDSPLPEEHRLVGALLEEVAATGRYYDEPNLKQFEAGRRAINLPQDRAARVLLAAAEHHVHSLMAGEVDYARQEVCRARHAAERIIKPLSRLGLEFSRSEAFDFLLYAAMRPSNAWVGSEDTVAQLISLVEREAEKSPLAEGERYVLWLYRSALISLMGRMPEEGMRVTRLIGDGAAFCLVPGEVWADAVNEDFTAMEEKGREGWGELFVHARTATAARPSGKWLKTAGKMIETVGGSQVHERLHTWLPLVAKGRSLPKLSTYDGDTRGTADTLNEENATCLRGLLWLVQLLPKSEELAHTVTAVALTAYKKVPGVGPRAVKVGNAAVYALSEMPSTDAVGQLAMLKVRVKFGTAQKEIEKAFTAAADKIGLAREDIEEMGVPSYGLEPGGQREELLGEYKAKVVVNGSEAQLHWFDVKGKALKSVPAKVKKEHAEDVKDLQQSLKDIQAMLPAQRDRLDSMFLLQKSWPVRTWSERYLNHPLIGTIARRLLWCVDGTAALFVDGAPVDVDGKSISHGQTAEITMWHPVGRSVEEITGWRRRLEELGIVQPFKQAHREVYLLTDAERRTRTYSNRFAAHVIRQHQFNALCAARGWKNKLRLMVDDAYQPPTKNLPVWGLRAEFWVESIGEDYGRDTNESGVFLRLSTDQVRFYRLEAAENYAHAGGGSYTSNAAGPGTADINEPLPLETIPPLVLSEVMRDVDLFVGVASIGNDPTWQDGGPEGRYREYWQRYAFGELSGTAATRKQVLERLIPRLNIADQCSFSDRFLIVRGRKRTYKIHLGSGNILMEPNDQYLCIVPDSRARSKEDDLFLPFEGDNTLSIILSKALLLADDDKIQDPSITRQIQQALAGDIDRLPIQVDRA